MPFKCEKSGFSAGSGQTKAAVSTKRVWLRCTRFRCADGQVGGGTAAEYPVAAAARLS